MRLLTESDPDLLKKTKHAITIPGINFVTAFMIIAETDGFANIGNQRQLVSCVGLNVVMKESGTLTWRPIYPNGAMLTYVPDYIWLLSVPSFTIKPSRLILTGLKKMANPERRVSVAMERKLLVLTYTLYKNERDFRLDYQWQSYSDI